MTEEQTESARAVTEGTKCGQCGDQGYIDLDRGGITSMFCDCEAGKAYRTKKLAEMGIEEPVQKSLQEPVEVCIGVCFQLLGERTDECTDEELWKMAKQGAIERYELPWTITLSCGNDVRFDDPAGILELPIEDIPCICGNPSHYSVKFEDNRIDPPKKRKAANVRRRKRGNAS